jgi:D-alanine-D-alanine ligase
MANFHTEFRRSSQVKILSATGSIHVVMLAGGMSAEREVSLISGQGIGRALIENGYRVTEVDMGADIASVLIDLKPDIVFNALHGTYGEDGCIQGLLDILHIPYTHSGVLASALAFNKAKSREILISNNIKCASGKIVSKHDNLKSDPIERPYVIKPLSQGSSVGVEVIFKEDDFNFADYKFEYGNDVIIEKYIKGRELQIAVLNGKALDVLEIKLLKNRFYDYETKYTDGFAEHIIPAQIPENIYKRALEISEKANNIFGCRGLVRVEMIYCEEEGELYMLELNTHPGMTPLSICPEIAQYNGISYKELVRKLVADARFDGDEYYKVK